MPHDFARHTAYSALPDGGCDNAWPPGRHIARTTSGVRPAMRIFSFGVLALGTLVVLAGCATNPTPQAPQLTTVTCKVPTFASLQETKEMQEKGGIQIAVGPVTYQPVRSSQVVDRDIQPSFGDRLLAPQGWQYMRLVERTTMPALTVQPEHLRFRITINNQLPRVFRGAGAVVQFNVGGKLIQVDQTGYADLVNVIVPPRTQTQVEVYGPSIAALPEQATIGLFIYDVVTKTDAAGNIAEKQNFEWYFNYAPQLHQEAGTVNKERLWLGYR
jgi:hypothetical protein